MTDGNDVQVRVQKGVPIPPPTRKGGSSVYPFNDMEVGDSFFVPHSMSKHFSATAQAAARRRGWKMVTRTVTEAGAKGTRVWRSE